MLILAPTIVLYFVVLYYCIKISSLVLCSSLDSHTFPILTLLYFKFGQKQHFFMILTSV